MLLAGISIIVKHRIVAKKEIRRIRSKITRTERKKKRKEWKPSSATNCKNQSIGQIHGCSLRCFHFYRAKRRSSLFVKLRKIPTTTTTTTSKKKNQRECSFTYLFAERQSRGQSRRLFDHGRRRSFEDRDFYQTSSFSSVSFYSDFHERSPHFLPEKEDENDLEYMENHFMCENTVSREVFTITEMLENVRMLN